MNTNSEQDVTLTSPTNAENEKESNNNYSTKLVEREIYEDSPLMINKIEEKGWFITLGNKRLTEYKKTKEEIVSLLEKPTWQLLITIMIAVHDDMKQLTESLIQSNINQKLNEIENKQ